MLAGLKCYIGIAVQADCRPLLCRQVASMRHLILASGCIYQRSIPAFSNARSLWLMPVIDDIAPAEQALPDLGGGGRGQPAGGQMLPGSGVVMSSTLLWIFSSLPAGRKGPRRSVPLFRGEVAMGPSGVWASAIGTSRGSQLRFTPGGLVRESAQFGHGREADAFAAG